jgi:hypothetical protein
MYIQLCFFVIRISEELKAHNGFDIKFPLKMNTCGDSLQYGIHICTQIMQARLHGVHYEFDMIERK